MALRTGTQLPAVSDHALWIDDCPDLAPGSFSALFVHFWAMSCPACKALMPAVQALRDEYAALGVRFVAVHSPRMPSDIDDERVRSTAKMIGITEPCALDNESLFSQRFELGGIWPYYFLFDSQGNLKLRGAGGIGLKLVTNSLKRLVPLA